jgi:hypothetical protein
VIGRLGARRAVRMGGEWCRASLSTPAGSRSTRAAPPPIAVQPSRRLQQPSAMVLRSTPSPLLPLPPRAVPVPRAPHHPRSQPHGATHANAAPSTPDRTVTLTKRSRQGALQIGELGDAADPAPDRAGELIHKQPTAPANPRRIRNAERRGHSLHSRIRRMQENGDLQIHQFGEPAQLRRQRPAQPI